MKISPTIQPLRVPDHVFVDMHTGTDFVPVKTTHLDADEIRVLLEEFVLQFSSLAGYRNDKVYITILGEEEF